MSNINRYLANARNRASQQYHNAGGMQIGTSGAPSNSLVNTNGGIARGFSAAGAAQPAAAVAPSYIIQISNSSNATYTGGFNVLGAFEYLYGNYGGGTWDNSGNLTVNGITISSVYTTVTYQQILSSTQSQPFQVGSVYLQSIQGNTNQVSDVYTLTTQSTAGELYSRPIKPYINPNQYQNTITYNNSAFVINGYTKLTWSNIYATSVFQVSFFPAAVIDPAQSLNGTSVQSQYTAPNVATNTVTLR
jgi:hypothetical protein